MVDARNDADDRYDGDATTRIVTFHSVMTAA